MSVMVYVLNPMQTERQIICVKNRKLFIHALLADCKRLDAVFNKQDALLKATFCHMIGPTLQISFITPF